MLLAPALSSRAIKLATLTLIILACVFTAMNLRYISPSSSNRARWSSGQTTNTQPASKPPSTSVSGEADDVTQARLTESYGKLPLSFEVNEGQHDSRVMFSAPGSGYNLFLTANEAVLQLRQADVGPHNNKRLTTPRKPLTLRTDPTPATRNLQSGVVRLKLLDADAHARAVALDELPGKVNYFIGNDPSKWRTDIPTFAKVKYEQVYPGVDVVYYGRQGKLEYDFEVAPGVDPGVIKLTYRGIKKLRVNAAGDLVLLTAVGEVVQHKPLVYQKDGEKRDEVACHYEVKGSGVRFLVDSYDRNRPLIIDPVMLVYSTYLGGGNDDQGNSVALDSAGNAYIAGQTASTDFPTANPLQTSNAGGLHDIFVSKLNASGSALIYSTYLGGSGDDLNFLGDIAVDSAGNAYVTGYTQSANFPTANPLQVNLAGAQDVFVTKLNTSGSALIYSTYLGGSDYDVGYGIAVDSAGNGYIIGNTNSTNFPTANPLQANKSGIEDAFVTKLNAAGSALTYSTYLGGSGLESGTSITVDSEGNAYVTGQTNSTDFPTASPLQASKSTGYDAFVTKFNASGSAFIYSTYLGGNGNDETGLRIAADSSGNAYVTGNTDSTDFPTAQPLQSNYAGNSDAFVTKLNASGSALIYSTYLGGNGYDQGSGIAVDSSGNAFIAGVTNSINFPTADPLQSNYAGGQADAFVTKLKADGSALIYSTYLGGSGEDQGNGVAVDSSGNAYVTGYTASPAFPVVHPLQSLKGGSFDSFITKISDTSICTAIGLNPSTLASGMLGVAYNQSISASGGTGDYSFAVSSGTLPLGLTLSSSGILSGTPTAAGSFSSTVTATDTNGCSGNQSYLLTISPTPAVVAMLSGNNQSAQTATVLSSPLAVKVTDTNGNPVIGVPVAWRVSGMPLMAIGQSFGGTTQKIAFRSDRAPVRGIFVMDVDGNNQIRLTANSGDLDPTWFPDSTKIAFRYEPNGDPNADVFVMNADGTNRVNLTNNLSFDSWPAPAPDGSKIAFTSDRSGNYDIYVMNVDGTNLTQLTTNSANDYSYGNYWSPDGSRLVFVSQRDGNDEVYVMNSDGTGQVRLTNDPAIDAWPTWSPDGSRIAFSSRREGTFDIYVMNADGTNLTQLTSAQADEVEPSWSPDGSKIVFRAGNNIWMINADGSNRRQITTTADGDFGPVWSPAVTTTDINGIASVSFTLGNKPGGYFVTASCVACSNTSSATFSINTLPAEPALSLSKTSISYGDQTYGTTSAAQTITISNTGSASLNFSSISLLGNNSGDFTISSDTCSGATLVQNSSCEINVRFAPTGIGNRIASLILNDNAQDSPQSVQLSGNGLKAALTVTAEDKQKSYGADNPNLIYTITGFVNNDSASVVMGTPFLSTTATQISPVGTYPISASIGDLSAVNYDFQFTDGILTVNKAALIVIADDKSRTYGSTNPQLTAHYTGFVLGQDASVISGSPAFSATADAGSAPGDYAISPSQGTLSAANYSFTSFTPGTLHVGKAEQIINWGNPSVISYGTALGPAQLNATVSVIGPAPAGALSYTPAAGTILNAGDQILSVTVVATTYYNEATTIVTIHVDKMTPTVHWSDPADITYGTAIGSTQLNATSPVAGSFAYSPATGTVLNAGSGQTLSASFTPVDSSNYNAATASVLINVLKATAGFSNLSSPVITYGTTSTILSGKIGAGSLIPTGSVSVTLDGATQSAAINSGDGSFFAIFSTGSLGVSAAPYSISYSYAGDSNFSGTNGAGILTVNKANTSTGVSSGGATSTYGQPVTFTATVASGGGTPTGNVQFFDGATSLGVVALGSGGASLTTSALAAGTHSITASYLGGANFNGSASPALTQTVNQAATSTALASSPNPSVAGQSVTFTAGVASGGGVPAGSVEFFDGTTSLGVVSLNGGSAALTTSALGAGSHQITAVYGGGTNFLGSASAALSQTVAAPTPAGKNVTVQLSAGTTTVQLTFTNVQTAGNTTITPIDPASAGAVPGDFVINGSSLAFDIQTTAAFTGKITVVFYVPSVTDPTVFNSLQIIHYVNGQPKVEKTTRDFASKTISATVTSLSPFLIVQTIDHTPPVIVGASVTPSVLSPPNHKMVDVTVNYGVADDYTSAAEIDCQLSVSSNEPINGTGDGDTAPDWVVVDAHHVQLRSERAGTGSGRVYTITITCTDRVGNSSSQTLTVRVPRG